MFACHWIFFLFYWGQVCECHLFTALGLWLVAMGDSLAHLIYITISHTLPYCNLFGKLFFIFFLAFFRLSCYTLPAVVPPSSARLNIPCSSRCMAPSRSLEIKLCPSCIFPRARLSWLPAVSRAPSRGHKKTAPQFSCGAVFPSVLGFGERQL
jgi:hypothetical protein